MKQATTEWFINTAEQHGVTVHKIKSAPNGGEVVYFNMPNSSMALNGKKNPYFMIWTGNDEDYKWHAEFGHWYFPKNNKERKQWPTTEHFGQEQEILEQAIKQYVQEMKEEA
jgi:hypothetical protein